MEIGSLSDSNGGTSCIDFCFFLAMMAIANATSAPSIAQEDSAKLLIIYDSSNSMWGKLADQSRKVEAGRAALTKLLQTGIGKREVGFRAYGHRRVKDCRDSELVVRFSEARRATSAIKAFCV